MKNEKQKMKMRSEKRGRARVTSISCWLWGDERRFVPCKVMMKKMKKRGERRHVIGRCVRVRGKVTVRFEMKFGVGGG